MQNKIAVPARFRGITAYQTSFIGFVNGMLQVARFIHELAANIDKHCVCVDSRGRDQCTFDQTMGIEAQNIAIFARAGFGLIGVYDQVVRTLRRLRHKRPFKACRKTRAAAPAKTGELHFRDNRIASLLNKRRRIVPHAATLGALKRPRQIAIQVCKDAVLVA